MAEDFGGTVDVRALERVLSTLFDRISETSQNNDSLLEMTRDAQRDLKRYCADVIKLEAEYRAHVASCEQRMRHMQRAIDSAKSRLERHSRRLTELDGNEITQEHHIEELRENTLRIRKEQLARDRRKTAAMRWAIGTLIALSAVIVSAVGVLLATR